MYRSQKIESFDLPELQPYRTMRRQHEHRQQGIFVAEGEKVVRRLLESSFGVVSVLLPEKWLRELEPLLQARPEEIQVFVAEKALLETLTGFSMYQGLLAVGKVPPLPTLEEMVARSPQPRLLAAADGLSSAENLGALVRNCAAFNAQALIVGETCSSPFLRRAVRSSMGTIFQMPIVETRQPDPGAWRPEGTRHPLHRRPSARRRPDSVAGKLHRRLLHRVRQRRLRSFAGCAGGLRRSRGYPHAGCG